VCGGVVLQHDVVPALSDNHTVAHHHGSIALVALADGFVTQGARPRQESSLCRFGRLWERRQPSA
jgi:hypothetical protein